MDSKIKLDNDVPNLKEEKDYYSTEHAVDKELLESDFRERFLCYNSSDLLNICRICLAAESENMKSLVSEGDDNLRRMFTYLTSIKVNVNENLPSTICQSCSEEVMHCYKFKRKCAQADAFLKEKLKEKNYIKLEDIEDVKIENLNENGIIKIKNEFEEDNPVVVENDDHEEVEYLEEFFDDIPPKANKSKKQTTKRKRRSKKKKRKLPVSDFSEEDVEDKQSKTKDKSEINNENSSNLVCSLCSKCFRSKSALDSHSKCCDASLPHRCVQCDDGFSTAQDLRLHTALHRSGPPWTCVQCDKTFSGRNKLRRHLYRHMEAKRYVCAQCGKGFAELYALRRHARVHTGEPPPKLLACPHCPKKFAARPSLATHLARHGGTLGYMCADCGKAFANARLLKSHSRTHTNAKPFECAQCDRRFRHESTLVTHRRTHTGDRPYVCACCGKAFIQQSNLTQHMRTHTGERPYSCSVCARRFTSGSALRAHRVTHTGEKPYACPICQQRFARKCLRRHMTRHGSRAHACALCPRRFISAQRLREHATVHSASDEKTFECAECGRRYQSKTYLAKHLKSSCSHQKTQVINKIPKVVDREQPLIIFDPLNEDIHEVIVDTSSQEPVEVPLTDQIVLQEVEPKTSILVLNEAEAENYQNLCLTSEGNLGEVSVVTPGVAGTVTPAIKVYRVDQSLLQIHSAGGQLTISKITSKMTANFQ